MLIFQPDEPEVSYIGSNGNYNPFVYQAGIPSMDIRFRGGPPDSGSEHNISMIFPTRHTGYDNFEGYKNLLDKDMKILNTCSQVIVHIVRDLADSKLLPFDIQEYSTALG